MPGIREPESWVKAYNTNDEVIATFDADYIYANQLDFYLTYPSSADLDRLEFYTPLTDPTDGFGFTGITTVCPVYTACDQTIWSSVHTSVTYNYGGSTWHIGDGDYTGAPDILEPQAYSGFPNEWWTTPRPTYLRLRFYIGPERETDDNKKQLHIKSDDPQYKASIILESYEREVWHTEDLVIDSWGEGENLASVVVYDTVSGGVTECDITFTLCPIDDGCDQLANWETTHVDVTYSPLTNTWVLIPSGG
jgi:hypothetical protein